MNKTTAGEADGKLELQRVEPLPVAQQQPSVGAMLQAVIDKGVSEANIGAVEKLVALYERMQERDAEREFARAFNALQADMPKIVAKTVVPNNDGTARYKFAAYEDIMEQVRPYLQRNGFTVTFSQRFTESTPQRLVAICTLQHVGGHSKSNEFAVRIGSGPPKATETQADGAAGTYAKRFALCNALNIVIEKDSDARLEGAAISPEQAADLEKRVHELGMPVDVFLKFCNGAKSFAEIPEASYQPALDLLASKAPKPASEKSRLMSGIWNLLVKFRGTERSWTAAEAWLLSKKILVPTETISGASVERLREVLEKVQIELGQ